MEVLKNRDSLNLYISSNKLQKRTIGFVPTMGFLHKGHESLILESKRKADLTLVSIFVNPTQFDKKDDFDNYPINIENDLKICESLKVNAVFLPTVDVMYPFGYPDISIEISHLMNNLCAKTRKGHMRGVLCVLSILFHLIKPNFAFFGKKDYQQYLLTKYMCDFLAFNIEIIGIETYREKNGLAMSSRNSRLTSIQKEEASLIFQILQEIKKQILQENFNFEDIKQQARKKIEEKNWTLDYLEILDANSLKIATKSNKKLLIAIAIFISNIRLIDNIDFEIL